MKNKNEVAAKYLEYLNDAPPEEILIFLKEPCEDEKVFNRLDEAMLILDILQRRDIMQFNGLWFDVIIEILNRCAAADNELSTVFLLLKSPKILEYIFKLYETKNLFDDDDSTRFEFLIMIVNFPHKWLTPEKCKMIYNDLIENHKDLVIFDRKNNRMSCFSFAMFYIFKNIEFDVERISLINSVRRQIIENQIKNETRFLVNVIFIMRQFVELIWIFAIKNRYSQVVFHINSIHKFLILMNAIEFLDVMQLPGLSDIYTNCLIEMTCVFVFLPDFKFNRKDRYDYESTVKLLQKNYEEHLGYYHKTCCYRCIDYRIMTSIRRYHYKRLLSLHVISQYLKISLYLAIPKILGIAYYDVPKELMDPISKMPMIYPVILEPTKTVVDKSTAIQIMLASKKDPITNRSFTHFVPDPNTKKHLNLYYQYMYSTQTRF